MTAALNSNVSGVRKATGVSAAECVVSFTGCPPEAGTMNTSIEPSRSLAKAIDFPSGLHTGAVSYAGLVVI